MSYTFKPKTAAEPSPFYKPPSAGFNRTSSWGSSKPAAPPEPKVDVKDYAAFPSLGSSLPPRASLRLPSKELPPPPKLGAWTAVAAKPAAPVVMPKPEVSVADGGAGGGPRALSAIGTRCYDDGPEDYDGPDEGEEEEEGEFNAELTSNRRRGDKGVW
jgi:hypothetical protein